MRQDIIEYLQKEIKGKCELPSIFLGMGCFYHITDDYFWLPTNPKYTTRILIQL